MRIHLPVHNITQTIAQYDSYEINASDHFMGYMYIKILI